MKAEKLKIQRSLKLRLKEINQTKKRALNSNYTIYYKNNLLAMLELLKKELSENK